jgi:hypothetical protein
MISEFHPLRRFAGAALPGLVLGLALSAASVRAEDPLLGRIKVIKCVGCDPGAVNLIVHDPIDVIDFEVQIKESDYQKIVTPLAGKTVFDKSGCFYWMDMPKAAKPPVSKEPAKDGSVKDGSMKDASAQDGAGKTAKKGGKNAESDSSSEAGADRLVETSAPPPTPVIEGKPSRCIPYVRIEPKPTHPNGKKDEE